MYWYNFAERHLSNPSVSCPLISEQQSGDQNFVPENIHFNRPALGYVNSRQSEINISRGSGQNRPEKIIRNIFTQLRSPSSEELAALLNMSSESCKLLPDRTNFYSYYSKVQFQKEFENSTPPNLKQRNVACLCKPVNEINEAKEENIPDSHRTKNRSCLCVPRYSNNNSEKKKTKSTEANGKKKLDKETNENNVSSDGSSTCKEIRVCLPIDPGEFGENFQEKGLKLLICGDRKSCDCKQSDVEVAGEESSSFECLACTISKNPQFKNLLTGLTDGEKKKNKKNGLSSRLSSSFSFFKKKNKNIQAIQCSDKCEQTCLPIKSETMANKACSCTCCSEPVPKKKNRISHCSCNKCGKVDLQKFVSVSPTCNCSRDDTWKMVLKMESKQNYRQIKQILKEINDQRHEIRDLHRRYTSLIKMQIGKASGGESSDKIREYFNNSRRDQLDPGLASEDIKELKDAINRSTVDQQNKPEKTDADTNTNEKHIAKVSELSLFAEDYKDPESNFIKLEKPRSVSDIKETTDNESDSCSCLMDKIRKSWKQFFGIKPKVCPKQCQCKATKPVEKCKNLFEQKAKVRPK